MGVITTISLQEVQQLFPTYHFYKLVPTSSGVVDTTYIVHTQEKSYILKKYERHIPNNLEQETLLLQALQKAGLNTPLRLESNKEWHLYTRLKGSEPKRARAYHIQAVGRFLATMHKTSAKIDCNRNNAKPLDIKKELQYTKENFFSYYKKFAFLKQLDNRDDGIIHGDIFKDNTLFDDKKIGVIDFVDAFCGSFVFDAAVALVGFDVQERDEYLINLFLSAYNQNRVKKLSKKSLKKEMRIASHFYALKRVHHYKNTHKARELLR